MYQLCPSFKLQLATKLVSLYSPLTSWRPHYTDVVFPRDNAPLSGPVRSLQTHVLTCEEASMKLHRAGWNCLPPDTSPLLAVLASFDSRAEHQGKAQQGGRSTARWSRRRSTGELSKAVLERGVEEERQLGPGERHLRSCM